nr:amidohydrolase family protein [uncultured Butyrivibrio sp.]
MKHFKEKKRIIEQNPELELCDNGDFRIRRELVEGYEIIDTHCHLYRSLSQLFPAFLQKEIHDPNISLMDKSCFPFAMDLFDLDKVYFTSCPTSLGSIDGIRTRIKLLSGAFVINYATEERLLRDMDENGIHKALVLQINPPGKSCRNDMEDMVQHNKRLLTFGSIHPMDENIPEQIDSYMKLDIKGWKLNPHIWGVPIDCKETVALLKELAKTGLPIISCSGIGLPEETLRSHVPSKQTKKEVMTQKIDRFRAVLDQIPEARFVMAHSGCFDFEGIIPIMKEFPNTYTDISIQPAANIRRLIAEIGSDRIMFGTDYPFVSQAFSILSVLRATSDEEQRRKIFSGNAKTILSISST